MRALTCNSCHAGKVKDLYEAVAKVVCPPGDEPHKVLLLAEYDTRHSLTMHIKASEPLSTVQTSNGPGFYSSTKPLLLAYHYASEDRGPHSGKRLLVYHRFCSAEDAVLHIGLCGNSFVCPARNSLQHVIL